MKKKSKKNDKNFFVSVRFLIIIGILLIIAAEGYFFAMQNTVEEPAQALHTIPR